MRVAFAAAALTLVLGVAYGGNDFGRSLRQELEEAPPVQCEGASDTSCSAFSVLKILVTGGRCEGTASADCKTVSVSETKFKEAFEEWWGEEGLCDEGKAETAVTTIVQAVAKVWSNAGTKVSCDGQGFACGWTIAKGNTFAVSLAEAVAQAAAEAGDSDASSSFCFADVRSIASVFAEAAAQAQSAACSKGETVEDFESSYVAVVKKGVASAFASARANACDKDGAAAAASKCVGKGESTTSEKIVEVGDTCAGAQQLKACTGTVEKKCCAPKYRRSVCTCRRCKGPWFKVPKKSPHARKSFRNRDGDMCTCIDTEDEGDEDDDDGDVPPPKPVLPPKPVPAPEPVPPPTYPEPVPPPTYPEPVPPPTYPEPVPPPTYPEPVPPPTYPEPAPPTEPEPVPPTEPEPAPPTKPVHPETPVVPEPEEEEPPHIICIPAPPPPKPSVPTTPPPAPKVPSVPEAPTPEPAAPAPAPTVEATPPPAPEVPSVPEAPEPEAPAPTVETTPPPAPEVPSVPEAPEPEAPAPTVESTPPPPAPEPSVPEAPEPEAGPEPPTTPETPPSAPPISCPGAVDTSCSAYADLEILVTGGSCHGSASADCKAVTETTNAFKATFEEWYSDGGTCDSGKAEAASVAVATSIAKVWANAAVKVTCDGQGFACGWGISGGEAWAESFAEAIAEVAAEVWGGSADGFCYGDIRAVSAAIAEVAGQAQADACTTGETVEDFENSYAVAIQKAIASAFASATARACSDEGEALASSKCVGSAESTTEGKTFKSGDVCAGVRQPKACEGSGKTMCCDQEFKNPVCRCDSVGCANSPWVRKTELDVEAKSMRSFEDRKGNVCFCLEASS